MIELKNEELKNEILIQQEGVAGIKVIDIKLEDLKPYKRNPRKNNLSVEPLKRSIQKYGFNVPLVIDNNGEIITGHTRYIAAKELGLKSVPCVRKEDLNKKEIKEYRIADNKVAELSEWDEPLLSLEIDELVGLGSDLTDIGFSKKELDDLLDFDNLECTYDEEPVKVSAKKEVECPECGHKFTP